jgi:hypothetical protein
MTDEKKGFELVEMPQQQTVDLAPLFEKALELDKVEALERLVGLHERAQDRVAQQEFNAAVSRFKSECPTITHDAEATVRTKSGGEFTFSYAKLEHIDKIIEPIATRCGLNYFWEDSEVANGVVKQTCVLKHVGGGERRASASFPIDQTDKIAAARAVKMAYTSAKKEALIQVLGLTTTDSDDDGGDPALLEPIDREKVSQLVDMLTDCDGDYNSFCKMMGVTEIDQITLGDFPKAVKALVRKKAEQS